MYTPKIPEESNFGLTAEESLKNSKDRNSQKFKDAKNATRI